MTHPWLVPLFGIAFSFLPQTTADAKVIFVDSNAPPGGNGSSWATAFDDLGQALSSTVIGDDVWVAKGTYRPAPPAGSRTASFRMKRGVRILGGFAGTETLESLRDPVQNPTLLNGDLNSDDGLGFVGTADNSLHVVDASGVDSTAFLDGFTISGGNADDPSLPGGTRGGGLYAHLGSPTLHAVTFRSNRAFGPASSSEPPGGGGLGLDSPKQALIEDCVFESNYSGRGGGLFIFGGSVNLVGCRLQANEGIHGGAFASQNVVCTVTSCEFIGGSASVGGAMHVVDGPKSTVRVEHSRFVDNMTTTGMGAAIVAAGHGTFFTVVDCDFQGNHSGEVAGAIAAVICGQLTVEHSRFSHNTAATWGGAIGILAAPVTVTDSSFFQNSSHHVWSLGNKAQGEEVRFDRCSFLSTGNQPSLWSDDDALIQLDSSIVWGQDPTPLVGQGEFLVDYTTVKGGYFGTSNLTGNPQFENEATGDLRLKATSPCIDAGRPSGPIPGVDLHDDPRFLDGDLDGILRVDMGVDEWNSLHLEVNGPFVGGGTISIDSTGAPWPASLLLVSSQPGDLFLGQYGSLLVDVSGTFLAIPWPAPPTQVPTVLPATLPSGITIYVQQIGSLGASGTTSNRVTLSH